MSVGNPDIVLHFWFGELQSKQWWSADPDLDRTIAERFGVLHACVMRGEAFSWRGSADGRLAEIIVLDQFSRQLFRNQAQAFAADGMAVALAQEAVSGGFDRQLPADRRSFLYMPFIHSESLAIHEAAWPLLGTLGEAGGTAKSAGEHLQILQRFGRYPKRNAALGRTSTPEEHAYLADIGERMF